MDLCTVSGVVFDVTGQPKSGVAIFIMKTLIDGEIINQRHEHVATSDANGVIRDLLGVAGFTVPRDSTVFLYGSFFINGTSFLVENVGVSVSIPDSSAANLEDLAIAIPDDTIFLDTDNTLAANSDQRVPSQKAIKAYVDAIPGVGPSVSEAELTLSDNTTADASTSKHGFLKKLSGVASELMDGQGAWRTIAAILGFTPADAATLSAHTSNVSNPHSVTKTQVGLGSADNVSDANKPVSTAQALADAAVASAASSDATTKANTAQSNAISAAASDATTKANAAQAAAISAAATDASSKANTAQANAIAADPVKASAAEVTAGTNDTKFITPKAQKDAGIRVGLRWVLARDIPFGEWNDCAVNQTPIDVVTLPTGMLLYDIHVIPSNGYNDAEASTGGVLHFGWGELIGANENRGFESEFPHPFDISGVDYWFPLRPQGVGLSLGHWEYGASHDEPAGGGVVLTGRPVLIVDSAAAGPLRTQTGGIAADATAGSIKVLLLVQDSLGSL